MIYLLEDDSTIRELVAYTLTNSLMETKGFCCAADLRKAMAQEKPDLLILDIMLPGEDGLSLLRYLRKKTDTAELPIMMLTARGTEMDKVQGLDYGADDYIAKPFGMAELVARIRALLRRSTARQTHDVLRCGSLAIDRRAHKVLEDEEEIALTFKEYELLLLLMENSGTVFTREQLLDRVWDIAYDGGSRTVDVHIRTLRAKLGKCGARIETVRGVGYRFGGGEP